MTDYQPLFQALVDAGAYDWVDNLVNRLQQAFDEDGHGDLRRWLDAVDGLPDLLPSAVDLHDRVCIGDSHELSPGEQQRLVAQLKLLHPWRKGPYELFGIELDTEWRSDWKWDRLKEHIEPLRNRMVLDVGCGNGYHCWRMLGMGARLVIGIDPTVLSVMQFEAVRKLHGEAPVYVLPIGIDEVPKEMKLFDTVFSMGVLYHRRSPIDHLLELKGCLRPGGQLVLETLVVDGGSDKTLVPVNRYAQMRNVWFIPSCDAIVLWMRRCGYKNIRVCDVTKTTASEQRSTEWMQFQSLSDFLDQQNSDLTCEGYPAPIRAIFVGNVE
jgi:tRNA (mo5U34)-methyltransferase